MKPEKMEKGGWMIFVLLLLHMLMAMIPYLFCSPILMTLATDLSIPGEALAYVMSIFGIVSGVVMFIGSWFIDKLGYIKAFLFAVACEIVGYVLHALSPTFAVFMVARFIAAFGYGLNSTVVGSIASMWFKGKMFTAFNTLNTVGTSIGSAVAFVIALPLVEMLGNSWKNAYWVFAVVFVAYIILCAIFVKYPAGVGEALAQQKAAIKAGQMPKPEFPMKRVLKTRNFVLLAVGSIFSMCCHNLIMTFLPTYLTTDLNFDPTTASSITGLGTLVGLVGSILGGVLCAKTGRRKMFQVLSSVTYGVCAIVMMMTSSYVIILTMFVAMNIAFYIRMPAMSQYLVEDVQPFDPAIIAPAAALTCGAPQLANIVLSGVGSSLTLSMGIRTTLIGFAISCFVGAGAYMMMTECGPHAKKNTAQV